MKRFFLPMLFIYAGLFAQAPAWWKNLPDGQWTAIATGAGHRLSDVVPNPYPVVGSLGGAVSDLAVDWCGAAVNQEAGEYMFVSHGGHSSWAGNEAYILAVRDENPAWKRLTDPTPVRTGSPWVPANIGNGSTWPAGFLGKWLDGRPTSTHCSGEAYANGRVWFPIANSFSNEAGDGANLFYSFNLNYTPLVTARAAGTPLTWTSANIGPWEDWGPLKVNGSPINIGAGSGYLTFGSSSVDPVTGTVWYWGGKAEFTPAAVEIQTSGVSASAPPVYKIWNWPAVGYAGGFRTWTVIAHDLRIAVLANSTDATIYVLRLDTPSAGLTKVTNISGTGYFGLYQQYVQYVYAGAAYVAANSSIAVGDPKGIGRLIYKLQIPTTGSGSSKAYNPAGIWTWSTVNGGGTGPDNVPGANTYTRWNTIRDMGDGRQALIVCSDVNAVHVYKVPAGGLGASTSLSQNLRAAAICGVNVSPNPVSGAALLQGDGVSVMTLFNIEGRQVAHFSGNKAVWETRNMPTGVYTLRASQNGKGVSRRIFVRH